MRGSRGYIAKAVEGSLRRLGTDYIDRLYRLHPRPVTPFGRNPDALADLVTAGKVRYIGSSNMTAWEVVNADWPHRIARRTAFITAQNEYRCTNRSAEAEPCPLRNVRHQPAAVLPCSPTACSPASTSAIRHRPRARLHRDLPLRRRRLRHRRRSAEVRRRPRHPLLDVAIGGLLAQPAVGSVISGATARADQRQCACGTVGSERRRTGRTRRHRHARNGQGLHHLRLVTTHMHNRPARHIHDRLACARLYLCTDARRELGDLDEFVAKAVAGGVDIDAAAGQGFGR